MTAPVKLSLAAVSPPPIELSDIGPDNLTVTIPALGTSVIADLLALEDSVNESAADANETTESQRAFIEAINRASAYVIGLLRKYNPKIPEDLDLPTEQVQFLLSGLAGGSTVASAVWDALSGSGLADPERLAREREERERASDGDGDAKPKRKRPLASAKRSPGPSSRSAKGTTGGRNGGATQAAPGQRSSSTSRKRSGH